MRRLRRFEENGVLGLSLSFGDKKHPADDHKNSDNSCPNSCVGGQECKLGAGTGPLGARPESGTPPPADPGKLGAAPFLDPCAPPPADLGKLGVRPHELGARPRSLGCTAALIHKLVRWTRVLLCLVYVLVYKYIYIYIYIYI